MSSNRREIINGDRSPFVVEVEKMHRGLQSIVIQNGLTAINIIYMCSVNASHFTTR